MRTTLTFTLIAASLWNSPVSADLQSECGETAVVATSAIRLKNNGYSQSQTEKQILEDAAEPAKAKVTISKAFASNTNSYAGMDFDAIYKITYKLCLAGIDM